MNVMELARKLAALQQVEDAQRAYTLALQQSDGGDPEGELEAALYLLQSGGDHRIAYTGFVSLYHRGLFQEDLLRLMTEAFYQPNVKLQKTRYEKNCKLLGKYKYNFRRDFPAFEDLPIQFFPYDDNGFLPYDKKDRQFGNYVNFNHPVVSRNFFQDLENPILAADVYSQYELEYLKDNVRKSEWVARENHVYLHYTDWETFCAHLQVLNLRPVLEEEKVVFLIEDQISQYPMDFKERFGIDYSQYTPKPIGIREVKRLIWHTQLSAHNGGDFFNEVFHGHPNLLATSSVMFSNLCEQMERLQNTIKQLNPAMGNLNIKAEGFDDQISTELVRLKNITEKDLMVANCLGGPDVCRMVDQNARIAPALFFQPHFDLLLYNVEAGDDGTARLQSDAWEKIASSRLFKQFPYVKTFTPLRRPTTSYGGAVRFVQNQYDTETGEAKELKENNEAQGINLHDFPSIWVLNRSFMIDWQERLFQDSVLVRFEDGKLNPKATFTALAAFLDIPYTKSLTYCSNHDGLDPETNEGNVRGFDPASVYKTYDEYTSPADRCFVEYLLRDVYEQYGYSFHYYDGQPMDEEAMEKLVREFTFFDSQIRLTYRATVRKALEESKLPIIKGELLNSPEQLNKAVENEVEDELKRRWDNRLAIAKMLMKNPRFVNGKGQPLHMMPQLQLDPALLEQPIYH